MIIKFHQQSQKTQQYPYANKKITIYIGRKTVENLNKDEQCIVIDQATASRKHLSLKLKKNKIYLQDLGSSNGTKVNGQQIQPKQLYQIDRQDKIVIGQSNIVITAETRQKQSQSDEQSSEENINRYRSRQKKSQKQFNISQSTLKMLKQMTSQKKTKSQRIKFLKLMGCKNVDEEWQQIERYLKKGNRFPTTGKKTNEELEKQFTSSRNNTEKTGLGAIGKSKSK